MKDISYHISRKYQTGPDDTLDRLQKANARDRIKLWAGSVIWFNGGFLDQFESYADNCPPMNRAFEDDFEDAVRDLLQEVGFSLSSSHWPTKRALANC